MHNCILRIKVKPIKLYNDNYQTHARDPAKSRIERLSSEASIPWFSHCEENWQDVFQSVHQSHEHITHLGWTSQWLGCPSHMVGHGVTTMFLIGCMVIARNGHTRWPTNFRLFCVFNLNHPMFQEKVKPFDQCQIMSSWRLCVYIYYIYKYVCVHIPTRMFHPKHPKKNLGMLPQVQERVFPQPSSPQWLCTPAEGAPSVNSSSAGSGLHGQWENANVMGKSWDFCNWDPILKNYSEGNSIYILVDCILGILLGILWTYSEGNPIWESSIVAPIWDHRGWNPER